MCCSQFKLRSLYLFIFVLFYPPIAIGDRVPREPRLSPAYLMPQPLLNNGVARQGTCILNHLRTSNIVMLGNVNMGLRVSQNEFGGLRGKQSLGVQMSTSARETELNRGAEDNEGSMSMLNKIDRGPRKDEKVKVFGARLDSKVASRGEGLQVYDEVKVPDWVMEQILMECNGDLKKAKAMLRVRQGRLAKAEEFFRSGVKSFDNGQYKSAIESFTKAIQISPGGAASREGGQYTIWLGQALDASGQRGKAVQTLRALMSHEDVDVRRVAKGLEYIYTAPQLDLGEEYFQWIDLEKIDVIKGGGKALQYSKLEKMPEKYSLEWYMLQKPKSMRKHDTGKDVQVALASTVTRVDTRVALESDKHAVHCVCWAVCIFASHRTLRRMSSCSIYDLGSHRLLLAAQDYNPVFHRR